MRCPATLSLQGECVCVCVRACVSVCGRALIAPSLFGADRGERLEETEPRSLGEMRN